MVFKGLQGSFNWTFEAPHSLGAKVTNASPGIVFATIGLVITFIVILQRSINYETHYDGAFPGGDSSLPRRRFREHIAA